MGLWAAGEMGTGVICCEGGAVGPGSKVIGCWGSESEEGAGAVGR